MSNDGKIQFGVIMLVVGIIIGIYAFFFFDVSVSSYYSSGTANMDLLNRRTCLMIAAAALFISGAVMSSSTNNDRLYSIDVKIDTITSILTKIISNKKED